MIGGLYSWKNKKTNKKRKNEENQFIIFVYFVCQCDYDI